MTQKRGLALLLALLLALALVYPALADVAKGSVANGQYDNGEGISFPMPEKFSLYRQENKDAGYFRITLAGPRDTNGFNAATIIDIIPGSMDVTQYEDDEIIDDTLRDYASNYADLFVIASETFTDYGVDGRRVFLTYRDGDSQNRTSYLCIYVFSTDRNIVRIAYDAYGAQRTIVQDLNKIEDLFHAIVVP